MTPPRSRTPRRRPRRTGAEQGSGTVLVAGACAVVLVMGMAGSMAVGAAVTASRARAAADLGALAGAGAILAALGQEPPRACAGAATVVARNGAVLTDCAVDGSVNVTVEVSVRPPRALDHLGLGPAVARARAGPAADTSRVDPVRHPDGRRS
jgi:secretion/DNA translocation related TadE-like protein